MKQIEIERKFLIEMPDINFLMSLDGCAITKIFQTYTSNNIRIRKCIKDNKESYIKTIKRKISDMSRIEEESEITKEEYTALLAFADQGRKTLPKTRYAIPYNNKVLEIDIFPFWRKQAFLEIELESENEEFSLPDFINVIKEVTFESQYKNYSLAKNIPEEENF